MIEVKDNELTLPNDGHGDGQARLLRDWVLSEDEIIRGGSIGILREFKVKDKIELTVDFQELDIVGWEEGKSCVGYPGFAPIYDFGTPEELSEQFGPNLYVREPLSEETIRHYENGRRLLKMLSRLRKQEREAVNRVWARFAAYKKKRRQKMIALRKEAKQWATTQKQSPKASLAKSRRSKKK